MPERPRIYCYKLTTDNNGAPCVSEDLLSLAICKPMIRRTAKEGDLLFGFAAKSLDTRHRLIYVAELSKPITDGAYYTDDQYHYRPDCIYQKSGDGYRLRNDAKYHSEKDHIERDLGRSKDWNRIIVLVSENFRYFGKSDSLDYRTAHPAIWSVVEQLRSEHRVNHLEALQQKFLAMKDALWRQFPGKRIWGEPSQKLDQPTARCRSPRQNCTSSKRMGDR